MQTSETKIIFCYINIFTRDLFIYFVCAVVDRTTDCHLIKLLHYQHIEEKVKHL